MGVWKRGLRGFHVLWTAGCVVGLIMGMGFYFNSGPVRTLIRGGTRKRRELHNPSRSGPSLRPPSRTRLAGSTSGEKCCGAGVHRGEGRGNIGQDHITTSHARMEAVPPGELGMARVECDSGELLIDHLTQCVRDSFGVWVVVAQRHFTGAYRYIRGQEFP